MMLTIQIDARDWDAFCDALRIDAKDRFVHGIKDEEKTEAEKYAYRILKARKAMGLDNAANHCCYNFVPTHRHEDLTVLT